MSLKNIVENTIKSALIAGTIFGNSYLTDLDAKTKEKAKSYEIYSKGKLVEKVELRKTNDDCVIESHTKNNNNGTKTIYTKSLHFCDGVYDGAPMFFIDEEIVSNKTGEIISSKNILDSALYSDQYYKEVSKLINDFNKEYEKYIGKK